MPVKRHQDYFASWLLGELLSCRRQVERLARASQTALGVPDAAVVGVAVADFLIDDDPDVAGWMRSQPNDFWSLAGFASPPEYARFRDAVLCLSSDPVFKDSASRLAAAVRCRVRDAERPQGA